MRRLLGRIWMALISLLPVLLTPAAVQAEDPLRIGVIATLSGPGATIGRDAMDGLTLAFEQFAGRPGGVEVELVEADDAMSVPEAARIADRLLGDGVRLFLVASAEPEVVSMLAARAAQAKAFVISIGAPPPALAGKQCSPWLFSLASTTHGEDMVLAHYLRTVGYSRLWLALPDTAKGRYDAADFRRYFNGIVVGESSSRPGAMNFASSLAPIGRADLDGLYVLHTGGMAVNFLRQYGQAGLKRHVQLFGPGSTFDQPTITAAGEAVEDALAAAPWSEDLDNPANLRMVAEFEARFGRPPSIHAAIAHDAGMLLDAAFRAGSKDPRKDDALRTALRTTDFVSVRGGLRFASNQFPLTTWYLRQVVRTARNRLGHQVLQVLLKDQPEGVVGECGMHWENPLLPPPPKETSKPSRAGSGGRR